MAAWHNFGFLLICTTALLMASGDHRALHTFLTISTEPTAGQEETNQAVVEETKVEVEATDTPPAAPQL